MLFWTPHFWSWEGRCFTGAGSYSDPATVDGSSSWPCTSYLPGLLFEPLDRMASGRGSSIWLQELQQSRRSCTPLQPVCSERSRLNRLIAGLIRAGFLPTDFPTFEELARQADTGLFRAICSNPDHVLRHYFTPKKPSGYNLRPRAHNFQSSTQGPLELCLTLSLRSTVIKLITTAT